MDPIFLLMMVGLIGLMFFMSSKQRKAARAQQEFRHSLGVGSHVMTTGGLIGTVVSIDEANDRIILESAGSRTEWTRAAIAKQVSDVAPATPELVTVVAGEGADRSVAEPLNESSALSELDTVAREYRASQER